MSKREVPFFWIKASEDKGKNFLMLYWLGFGLAFIGIFLSTNYSRTYIKQLFPNLCDNSLDICLIIISLIGLFITAIKHFLDKSKIDKIEYSEVATYNLSGNKSTKISGVPAVPTGIDDWNKDFFRREKEKIILSKCNSSVIQNCESVIKRYPSYPFSYYFLAICLKEMKNKSWEKYANKAKKILKKTTEIQNNHQDHNLVLNEINQLFNKNRR